jgi:hypothetical protein
VTSTIEIVQWSEGRLALTGKLENSRDLFERLREVGRMRFEYWAGDSFTFSFAARHCREVRRILEDFR